MSNHQDARGPREWGKRPVRENHDEGMSDEDRAWLESDLSRLSDFERYEWAQGELEAGEPVGYVPGIGAVAGAAAEERERLKREHPRLFGELALALARRDPIGLVGVGAPDDEYEPEVGTILSRLGTVSSEGEVLDVVHEEFLRWFGPEVAGPRERYAGAASEVWRVWGGRDRG